MGGSSRDKPSGVLVDWDGSNYLWTPVWGVLAACTVLCFDCHQLGDLTGGRTGAGFG